MDIKTYLANKIKKKIDINFDDILSNIVSPPNPEMGDFSFKTFIAAKTIKKNPADIASELKIKLNSEKNFAVKNQGPYLNFVLNPVFVCDTVIKKALDPNFGKSLYGNGKNILIDYSSPNIAKLFGVHHLRSTVIGASLYRIFKSLGYKAIGINHLGDWGTQFGLILAGYKYEGLDQDEFCKDSIKYAYNLYTRTNKRAKDDNTVMDEARSWFKKLENGDTEAIEIWEIFRKASIVSFKKTYSKLNIRFDHYTGESFYRDKIEKTIEFLKSKNICEEDDGALIIRLDNYSLPPVLLKKSDGATLYATRELASIFYRMETYTPDKLLYVVGNPQELHFKQIKAVLNKAKIDFEDKIKHIKFGHILGMSSRKGTLIFLNDVLNEAVERSKSLMIKRKKDFQDKDELNLIAEKVGIGAVVFNDLKNKRIKDVEFNWERVLSFDGNTGPYLQYAYARICSIIEKAETIPKYNESNTKELTSIEEKNLSIIIDSFPSIVFNASKEFEPSIVSTYLFELATTFSTYYHSKKILTENILLREARLLLIISCKSVLASGLKLLGIEPVNKM